MASVLNLESQNTHKDIRVRTQASFFLSQIILFNSRRKHGLLYSIATIAGLFCSPGIIGLMDSEIGVQILIQETLLLPLITLMITVGMFILNDLIDADLDKANSKNRPLPSGLVSKKQAWCFIICTNGAAVAMVIASANLVSVLLVVPMILIGILYSLPRKIAFMNRFIIKNASIALFYVLCIMLGVTSSYGIGLAIQNPIIPIHTMAMSGVMIFVGSIVNDLGDTKGDKAAGRRTIPVVMGSKNTVKMLVILLGCMPAISWMLYATFVKHNDSISTMMIMTPIAVSIIASLAIFRMTKIQKVVQDMKSMREQHKKWFPLYMILQLGLVLGSLSSL
jgi:geranylgeranylglycerol-phosphate geranylgeranyltransferase